MSTTIVYTCDRCGATFEDKPKLDGIRHRLYTANEYHVDTRTDLCHKCVESLHRWFEGHACPDSLCDVRMPVKHEKKKRWWQK